MLSQLELEARYAGGARLRPPILCTLIMPMKSSNAVAWHKKGTSLLKSPSQMSYFSVMVAMRVSARVAMTLLISVCSVS